MTQPQLCGRCGAPVLAGANGCSFCGVAFVGAPPGQTAATAGAAGADAEVVALLRARNKIGAVKVHRERYKTSLRDALRAVEAIEKQLGLG